MWDRNHLAHEAPEYILPGHLQEKFAGLVLGEEEIAVEKRNKVLVCIQMFRSHTGGTLNLRGSLSFTHEIPVSAAAGGSQGTRKRTTGVEKDV